MGYFSEVEHEMNLRMGASQVYFLKLWAVSLIENWRNCDKVIFWFSHGALSKVSIIKDRKVERVFDRDSWINPASDLDSFGVENTYSEEFLDNEATLMKYISFSLYFTPISDSEFIIPIILGTTATNG